MFRYRFRIEINCSGRPAGRIFGRDNSNKYNMYNFVFVFWLALTDFLPRKFSISLNSKYLSFLLGFYVAINIGSYLTIDILV